MKGSRTLEASDYVDGEDRQFTIDGLIEGEQYVFSAQARNQFGFSKFSGNSDLVTINTTQNPQPSKSIEIKLKQCLAAPGRVFFCVFQLCSMRKMIEICNGIVFEFYTRQPHVCLIGLMLDLLHAYLQFDAY